MSKPGNALDLDEVTPDELLALLGRPTDGSDITAEEVAEFLNSKAPDATKKRVLAWFSKVGKKTREKLGLGDVGIEVVVRPAHRGRVTGYSMVCVGCGLVAPRLAASFRHAELAAIGHLREDHESVGVINARAARG